MAFIARKTEHLSKKIKNCKNHLNFFTHCHKKMDSDQFTMFNNCHAAVSQENVHSDRQNWMKYHKPFQINECCRNLQRIKTSNFSILRFYYISTQVFHQQRLLIDSFVFINIVYSNIVTRFVIRSQSQSLFPKEIQILAQFLIEPRGLWTTRHPPGMQRDMSPMLDELVQQRLAVSELNIIDPIRNDMQQIVMNIKDNE